MSEYTDQLAQIVSTLEAITGIGNVHDRPRYTEDALTDYGAIIGGVRIVRAWEIGVDGDTVTDRVEQNFRHRYRPWSIRGYIGPVDVSTNPDPAEAGLTPGYKAALDLGLTVADAIEANRTLGGTCLDISDPDGGLGTRVSDPETMRLIGAPLCWSLTVGFWAWTIVTP